MNDMHGSCMESHAVSIHISMHKQLQLVGAMDMIYRCSSDYAAASVSRLSIDKPVYCVLHSMLPLQPSNSSYAYGSTEYI